MWFLFLVIAGIWGFAIYKFYSNHKYKKDHKKRLEDYSANEDSKVGPFEGDKVYHLTDEHFIKSFDIYRDKVKMSDVNENKTFWFSNLNSAELKLDLYDKKSRFYLVLDDGNDYDKYYDFGKPNYLKVICSDEKAREIVDFINSQIQSIRSGQPVYSSPALPQDQSPVFRNNESQTDKKLLYNIKRSTSSSFCQKCSEYTDESYIFRISKNGLQKEYELCKECAIKLKKQIDAKK